MPLLIIFYMLYAFMVDAQPLVIKLDDRIEINWTQLTIKLYGEATRTQNELSFKDAEIKARLDGQSYLINFIKTKEHFNQNKIVNKKYAHLIPEIIYSKNTQYSASGNVRVNLENPLSMFFQENVIQNSAKEMELNSKYSGIIFNLSKKIEPTVFYEIVNPEDHVLFSFKDVEPESFTKNLMGCWAKKPLLSSEITEILGKAHLKVDLVVLSPQKFQISQEDWQNIISPEKNLLKYSHILFTIP